MLIDHPVTCFLCWEVTASPVACFVPFGRGRGTDIPNMSYMPHPRGYDFLTELFGLKKGFHFTISFSGLGVGFKGPQKRVYLGTLGGQRTSLLILRCMFLIMLPLSLSVAKTGVTRQVSVVSVEPCLVFSLCKEGSLLDMLYSSTGNYTI